jgi:sugar lactone lactonase YvrE
MKYFTLLTKTLFVILLLSTQSCKKTDSNSSIPNTIPKKLTVSTLPGRFSVPTGVCVDLDGNVYVAEYLGCRIKVISSNGSLSTLAGNGTPGFTNGTGSNAQLYYPQQLTVDANKNVFVVGGYNRIYDKVRKISADGTVTSIAGDGTSGYNDGAGVNAQFNNPFGIVSDLQGNLFVSDADNNKIRKINPVNNVTTFATELNAPTGITIDINGNLFVADSYNHKIKKITPSGIVSTFAGSGIPGYKDGAGDIAQFNSPIGIAADAAGNLFVSDMNHRIRKIAPNGIVSTYAGTGVQGFANGDPATAMFNLPSQVAVDKQGNVYVADIYNNSIRKISLE